MTTAQRLNLAVAHHGRGELAAAGDLYRQVLDAEPDHPDALHLLGVVETQSGRAAAGLELIRRSLAAKPDQPVALANQGNALLTLGQPQDALAAYDHALRHWPDYHLASFGRGNALGAQGRHADALASYDRALAASPGFVPALTARGASLIRLQRFADALGSYDRALVLNPRLAQAHAGRASALLGLGDHAQAARSLERAQALAPDSAEVMVPRADLLSATGDTAAALEAYDRALQANPQQADVWFRRGIVLTLLGRQDDAVDSLRRALQLDPAFPFAAGALLHARMQLCDWGDHEAAVRDIVAATGQGAPANFPFSFLAVHDSPAMQRRCAETFTRLHCAALVPLPQPATRRMRDRRLRVAYISADFLEHPTAYLTAGLFECHDRSGFEIIGISLRDDPGSPMRRRISAAMDRFLIPAAGSDRELAALVRELDVDIAVDLMGYTGEHRAGLFAHRAAPIQVNYLGYPGSMGSAFHDYIIADSFLVPPEARAGYSEQVVFLPGSFQVNDARRPDAGVGPSRTAMGLPESGFVWCSFHGSYKLNPPLFAVWMRLLQRHPDSILWLVGGKPLLERNLGNAAAAHGVDPGRLVFARSLPYPAHLARLPLADLCLDTLPFTGGATTSDALWAGVPVLTCAGRSLAARMSGSLLHAVGLPELVVSSLREYEALASALHDDPGRLHRLRAALAAQRPAGRLFDTDRFTRSLEAAYRVMADRYDQGLPPTDIVVPDRPG